MPYGTIKVDSIVFTNGGVDATVTVSGLNASTSGNLTVTGTVSGTTANFASGNFSTQVSGLTVLGTSGTFTSLTGTTTQGTTASFTTGNYTSLTGTTTTGTTANFVSGVFTTRISGVTVTGTTASFTSGIFATFSSTTVNVTSGVFASGTAAAPSVSVGTTTNGLYSSATNEVALATNSTSRLVVDASGNVNIKSGTFYVDAVNNRVGIGTTGPATLLDLSSTTSAKLNLSYPGFGIATLASDSTGALLLQADEANTQAGSLIQFKVDGTERLRLDASGNLGLGVVPSAWGPSFVTLETPGASFASNTSGSANFIPQNAYYDSAWKYKTSNYATLSQTSAGAFLWYTAPSGTAGSAITFTQAMTLDASGNLGIGTTTIGTRLSIGDPGTGLGFTNAASGNFNLGLLAGTGSVDAYVYQRANGPLIFGTNNAERMRITSAGNVGIGTTPAQQLHVKGSSTTKILINSADNSVDRGVYFASSDNTELGYLSQEYSTGLMTLSAGTGSYPTPIRFNTSGSERARIDSSGRLLVGTSTARTGAGTTPQFFVEGTTFNTSALGAVCNQANTAGAYVILGKSRGTSVGSNTAVQSGDTIGALYFVGADGTNLVNGAGIEATVDGGVSTNDLPTRLVFSTTADGAASPTERMRIGNGGATGLYCDATNDTLYVSSAAAAGTTRYLFIGKYSATSPIITGANSILIFTNGNIQNTNNSYGAISDIKLKENIVDATSQWSDIKSLQIRKYNFKEGQTHTQIGLIAQEVELVSPGLVSESPDRDQEGNDLGTVTKSVNYSVLYMKAVKALQEAMERIETLEAKVAALEAR